MILVIGSSGFLGRVLCSKLREVHGETILEMNSENGGIENPKNFEKFRSLPVQIIYHLAAPTFVPESWKQPHVFLKAIANGTQNVLNFAAEAKASVVYVSAYVYGEQKTQPIAEDIVPAFSNPYAHAKLIAESYCRFHRDFLNLTVHIVRPFNIYGPGQPDRYFIPSLMRQAAQGDSIILENTSTKRDFIYVEDVIEALLLVGAAPGPGETFNVGSGVSTAIKDIVSGVQKIVGRDLVIRSENKNRINEISDCRADISKIQRQLGWSPRVSLEDGLRRTWESIKASKAHR